MTYFIKLLLLSVILIRTNQDIERFEFNGARLVESLELSPDSTFKYIYRSEFIRDTIVGIYSMSADSITLTSRNRYEDFKVSEGMGGTRKKCILDFKNYRNESFHYDLFLNYANGEVKRFRSQWGSTEFKEKNVKSFYIIDTRGLKSPVFYFANKRAFKYNIKWSGNRIFQNENWYYDRINGKIVPKGLNKVSQNYFLNKIER